MTAISNLEYHYHVLSANLCPWRRSTIVWIVYYRFKSPYKLSNYKLVPQHTDSCEGELIKGTNRRELRPPGFQPFSLMTFKVEFVMEKVNRNKTINQAPALPVSRCSALMALRPTIRSCLRSFFFLFSTYSRLLKSFWAKGRLASVAFRFSARNTGTWADRINSSLAVTRNTNSAWKFLTRFGRARRPRLKFRGWLPYVCLWVARRPSFRTFPLETMAGSFGPNFGEASLETWYT